MEWASSSHCELMETMVFYAALLLFLVLSLLANVVLQKNKQQRPENQPPSPRALPIIGHLHLLKLPIHRTLHALSIKHGPIYSLQLGSRLAVVVTSPSAAKECFTRNDIIFANRPCFAITKYLAYGNTTIGSAPYGDHWRNLRRLCTVEIFSSARLNMSSHTLRDETNILLRKLHCLSAGSFTEGGFAKVELKSLFRELTFNSIMRMAAGKRYFGDDVSEVGKAKEFRKIIGQLFTLGAYPGDFLPILKRFDFTGYLKKIKMVALRIDEFLQGLIDEQRLTVDNSDTCMIGNLLSLQKSDSEYYSDQTIKGLMGALIGAGTETTSVALEWAMANLLNHPEELEKAKAEIDSHLGTKRLLDESDLPNLPHLQNIITETLRLYPSSPLLAPHFSSQDCTIGGYNVPAETILFVNAWAIQRDPKVWEDAESFKPARFEDEQEEGSYRLMPFGLGRRACPGTGLANRTLGLVLGSLIQCFDWKRVGEEEIDMKEGHGLSMPKLVPLEAFCRTRSTVIDQAMVVKPLTTC